MAEIVYESMFPSKMAPMHVCLFFPIGAKWRRCVISLCSPTEMAAIVCFCSLEQNGGSVVFFSRRSKMAEEHVYFPSVCGGRGPVLQTQLSCGH